MRKYILLTIAILLIPLAVYAWMGAVLPAMGESGAAPASGEIGTVNEAGSATTGSPGYTYLSTQTTTTAGTISYGHIKITDGNGVTVCLALHNSSTGVVVVSGSATASDDTVEWLNIPMDSPGNISADPATYIVAVTVSTYADFDRSNISVPTLYDETTVCGETLDLPGGAWTSVLMTIIFNNSAGDPS